MLFFAGIPEPVVRSSGGEPLFSWRFTTQLNMGSYSGVAFEKSWRAPENQRFRQKTPSSFCRAPSQMTVVFGVTGPGTAFAEYAGLFGDEDEIEGDAILLVEVRNSQTHWMAPGDFDIRYLPRTINDDNGYGISGISRGGFHVGFADKTVWFLSNDTRFEDLAKFFTVESAKRHDREEVLGKYRVQ